MLVKSEDDIKLKNETYEVTYLPNKGMNMASFKKGNIELIDQSTRAEFEKRFAGLGALIGPHFHNRNSNIIPTIKDENIFPHIARVRAEGRPDPFSHGIGRYAPWKCETGEDKIIATLSGKDEWKGIPLADLEGQNFNMTFETELTSTGLKINLSVTSDTDSLVGIHYYYRLPNGKGTVYSRIQDSNKLNVNSQNLLTYPLDQDTDLTFHPYPNPREGKVLLDTEEYQLLTTYTCVSQENAWQLYHPKGATFACIEPVSAQDPRHANLSVSALSINIQILEPGEISPDKL